MQSQNQIPPASEPKRQSKRQRTASWLTTIAVMITATVLVSSMWARLPSQQRVDSTSSVETENKPTAPPEALNADVAVVEVSNQPPLSRFTVTGTVEPNRKAVQQVTPLVSGRVEEVLASTGDKVAKGDLLVVMDSPQVAELHGKLHEAETRVALAKNQLDRARQVANRVNLLKSKASLDEATATVKRDQLLVADGLAARKDLLASEAELTKARAEYDFQKDISLNREINEASAELSTAETEVKHLRDGLKALDAMVTKEGDGVEHDIAKIELRAPISGTVIERFVNPGSGVDLFKPLLTVANTANVWVIANVPEKQTESIKVGESVVVDLDGKSLAGEVKYIDPRLDEESRTLQVRIEVRGLKNPVPTGSFAQIQFRRTEADPRAKAFIPEAAIQTVNNSSVVFVKNKVGNFDMRKIEIGPRCCDRIAVYQGLSTGELIADNSFILKARALKSEFGGE
ncbi:MAG: efflux RND transporter periplasmic adaptor subunit [Candidatus Obscuribacterales bacterium]|nr:efflux RND transporter periplasmic adaptor subunit [Candidatus Obscuribacterales bacterium]